MNENLAKATWVASTDKEVTMDLYHKIHEIIADQPICDVALAVGMNLIDIYRSTGCESAKVMLDVLWKHRGAQREQP